MATIDTNFRADVNRAVYVFGEFTDELVNALAPKILELRQDDSRPITVFINSNGGSLRCLEFIYGLLSTKGASGKCPRIITVAVANAGSAAANLLAFGDYAIAYPNASIHFHGSRYGEVENVTAEYAALMTEQLDSRNKAAASALARSGTERLAFHYARLKKQLANVRKEQPNLSDMECFAICLKKRLSDHGDRIVDRALVRWQRLQELSEKVISKVRTSGKIGMAFEVAVLRQVIDFEVRRNRNTDWNLDEIGVMHVTADYLLLREYDLGRHNSLIKNLMNKYAFAFFAKDDVARISAVIGGADEAAKQAANEEVHQKLKPFCYFTTAIWQRLQEDENPLTPRDAYWLGAVDEVYDSRLPCMRDIAESAEPSQPRLPEQPSAQPSASEQ